MKIQQRFIFLNFRNYYPRANKKSDEDKIETHAIIHSMMTIQLTLTLVCSNYLLALLLYTFPKCLNWCVCSRSRGILRPHNKSIFIGHVEVLLGARRGILWSLNEFWEIDLYTKQLLLLRAINESSYLWSTLISVWATSSTNEFSLQTDSDYTTMRWIDYRRSRISSFSTVSALSIGTRRTWRGSANTIWGCLGDGVPSSLFKKVWHNDIRTTYEFSTRTRELSGVAYDRPGLVLLLGLTQLCTLKSPPRELFFVEHDEDEGVRLVILNLVTLPCWPICCLSFHRNYNGFPPVQSQPVRSDFSQQDLGKNRRDCRDEGTQIKFFKGTSYVVGIMRRG